MCLRCCCHRRNRATPNVLRWQSLIRKLRRVRRLQHLWHNLGLQLQHLGLSQVFRQRSRSHPREDWAPTWVIHLRRTRRRNGHPRVSSSGCRVGSSWTRADSTKSETCTRDGCAKAGECSEVARSETRGNPSSIRCTRNGASHPRDGTSAANCVERSCTRLKERKRPTVSCWHQRVRKAKRILGWSWTVPAVEAGCPATSALCIQTY